jgi:hypothetical protein
MSLFAARMERGLVGMYRQFGDPAVFTDSQDYCTDCTVIVDEDLSQYGDDARLNGKTAVVRVRRSELPFKPRRGETFKVIADDECVTYAVDSVLDSDSLEHRCLVA